ncbi:TPA: transcription-repair coupling factor [Candidatus Gastranaerophilales bacterium HUM_20]|nr:transcription-repair coupling factor [Clostridium sp. CAG:729]DAB19741.1 MAG TPA: transcription-repair coupling factor [Candidatus Gastranaerophilales bacterium HUM_20]
MFNIIAPKNDENYALFEHYLTKSFSFAVTGLTTLLRLLLIQKIHKITEKKVLVITATEQNALKYQNDLKKAFGVNADLIPFQNISMYESVSPNRYDYAEQVRVLTEKPDVVIAPVKALLEKFPTQKFYEENSVTVKVGDEIDLKKLIQQFVDLGYKRSTMVSDIGEFSVRGDIIDFFSLDKNAVRIELWGDEIVDIRYFNNESQKSIEKIKSAKIMPMYKFTLKNGVPDEIKKEDEEGYFEGIEVYQNYFNTDLASILDYFKDYIIVLDETSELYSKYEFVDKNFEEQLQENLKLGLNVDLKGRNHIPFEDFIQKSAGFVKVGLNNFIDSEIDDIIEFNSQPVQNFGAKLDDIAGYINSKHDYRIIIATDYPERVKEILNEREIFDVEYNESLSSAGAILEDFKTVILTDRELFNKRTKEVTSSKRSYYKEKPEYIENINDIKEGEYVVHSVHGVGVYKGLSQQEIDGQLKDYLTIEYANKDRLHIPAEQINLLVRYRGSGSLKPKLSRMGGKDWENTKTRVKKEVEQVAYDLLRLYAKRKMQTGIQFLPDTTWQVEMEEAFEYTETPDQMKAITDVKADMECEKPMDRLICGDVGFGKTEVAMRGIFKAVTSGKQVAVVVPTTILALQHFQTISERFKPFGVNVELMSRFRSQKEQKETIKHLATGECDVVIGTHRLLQEGIVFKDLGLLVIDEEHRFGVRHKEKLKQLRENIDIITMSATPIPRTLYMSLSGIKDMSIINTPPKNRLPIKTFVGEWNENMVKNAITHELDREGQVFYLYNRVETIDEFRMQLQKLVPNARIAIGHGQMDEKTLEKVIVDFANQEYDILLATTIIENGIDIPNANTMIIHNADKFGLAQLYQLRGRVGRSQRQAYCYCFYTKSKEITKEAMQRLKAIKEFTTLGSGYQIAMRDVEIRGVGNILGTKQHGHMVNVGFDTYCQLLEETVQELQGQVVDKTNPTIVDINVTAYIPDEWVGSADQKMIEYKRLADVKSEVELDYITEEWKDRFAKPPESVENLIKLIKLRLAATEVKIALIRETEDNIRIYTPYTQPEWKIIQRTLPSEILKRIKFTIAPKSCQEGNSILLLNNAYMNFNEVFNILTDLFYYINKTKNDYTKK